MTSESSPAATDEVRHSPLDAEHRALGGRMVNFAGWDMPIRYGSVLDEHRACRTGAVVFDVSHMGSVWLRGPGALDALQGLLTNDLGRIGPGRAQYTHLLDDEASVVDDLIVWWVGEEEFLVIPNASNTTAALAALNGGGGRHGRRRRTWSTSPSGGRCWPCRARRPAGAWRRWPRRRPRWPPSVWRP